MKKYLLLFVSVLLLTGCGNPTNTKSENLEKVKEEILTKTKANQESCDSSKPGSTAKYANKFGYVFTAEDMVQLESVKGLENFLCECNAQNKCEFKGKCVFKPWSSHCVARTDKAWMCNNGFYEFRNSCYDIGQMTEFCKEQFGYGFMFTGHLTGTLECQNIGANKKKYLEN